ncbi:MAG: response regulator [Pyrinomonadaceae bacterium]
MKLDFSSDNSAISLVEEDFAQNGHSENESNKEDTKYLRAGIKAAQRGDRAEARQMLMRVTEAEPHNESAWLWLASISEYPEELLIFLNNVLDINPENERAIEWAKATKSLLAKTFVQRGIEASEQHQPQFARQCFMQAIVYDNRNEMAWLWLASVTEPQNEKIAHFHRVLEINPDNETARESIRSTREKMLQTAFENAENAVDEGDDEKTEIYLNEVFELDPHHEESWFLKSRLAGSFEEKMACFEKMLAFDPENEKVSQAVRIAKDERAREFFEQATERANDGDRQQANGFLAEVFSQNPHHEEAWILKSRMTDSFEEKIACFEKILEFNPANETAQAGVKLRSMLNGNAPKMEEAVNFPNEEIVEQSFAEDFGGEAANDENLTEENSYFAEDAAEEMAGETQELEDTQELVEDQLPAGETDFVESFEDETVSSVDATQEFTYFADEVKENEQPEFSEPESSESEEEVHSEAVSDEMIIEEDFQNAGESDSAVKFEEASVEAEENLLYEEPSENLTEANNQEAVHHEPAQPQKISAEYSEDYAAEDYAGNEKTDSDIFAINSAEVFASPAMSENGIHAALTEVAISETEMIEMEMPEAQNFVEENNADAIEVSEKPHGEMAACPFCKEENEAQAYMCHSCRSLLTLSDIEMILAYQDADQEILHEAVENMEVEEIRRGLESDELVTLAIGHINMKNLRKGLEFLQKAVKLDSNNVVIESQANSLAIRLAEIEEKASIHSSMPKDRTIMVVDDSATVRKLISGKLEKCGHIVITAVDGMDAMSKLGDIVPDLILLDITMPRMDGYQVCKLIRNSDATKEIPIVMISGKDGFFDKVRGRMAGTTGYITKPFGPETLMKMLDTYLV